MAAEQPTATGGAGSSGGGIPFMDGETGRQFGLDTASRQLNRIRDMLMERAGGAADGIRNALRNLGGGDGGPAVMVDPEVSQQAIEVATNLW